MWQIEQITEISDEVIAAVERLTPRLASGNQVAISREYLQKVVANSANIWLAARSSQGGEIVGMAVLVVFELPTNVRALLENVVVDASYAHQGIGSALIERAKQEADKRLVNTIRASTGVSNSAPNGLLAKAGFTTEKSMNWYEYDIHQGPRI